MELLSLISVVGYALCWRHWRGAQASTALLHSVSILIAVLFFASLLNFLYPVTVMLLGGGLVLAATEIFRVVRNNRMIPVPLGIFALLGVMYWSIHSGSALFYYDEYSHWGVYIKEMLAKNALWGADTNAMHPRYLPGTSLWQYFFAIFSRNPEGGAYLAQFTLLITPLMVVWEKVRWQQFGWHIGIFALLIIALFNFGHGFTSLYVDHLLGAWFVGVLLNFLAEEQRQNGSRLLIYLAPLVVLVLIKTTGVFFALADAGIIALLVLVKTDTGDEIQSPAIRWRHAITFPLATIAICIATLSIWNFNRDSLDVVAGQGAATSIVSGLASADSVLSETQQEELTRRFIRVLLHQQISKDEISSQYNAFSFPVMPAYTDSFRLTTASLLGFTLIAIFCLWYAVIPETSRKHWVIGAGSIWLATVVYIAALYFGYIYTSTSDYGLILSSYIRYSHSMLLPVVLFCFAAALPVFAAEDMHKVKLGEKFFVSRHTVLFVVALTALYLLEPPYLANLYQPQPAHPFRAQAEPLTDSVRANTGPSRLWVFFPNNTSNGVIGQMLQYLLTPGQVHVEESPARLLENTEELRLEMRAWEYIWFADKSSEFQEASETLLGQALGDGLFRIEIVGDEIEFIRVVDTN